VTSQDYLKKFIGLENLPEIGDPSAYGKAVLSVLGADGEVSESERDYILQHLGNMGFPQVILSELEEFDPRNTCFESYAAAARQSSVERMLLYDAITGSMVDEYAERERRAVATAANLLGVDETLVVALEGLARIEFAARQVASMEDAAAVQDAIRQARISLIAPKAERLAVDDVAQAKRFHSERTGVDGRDVVPADFVEAVNGFLNHMEVVEKSLNEGQADEREAKKQVLQMCQDFSDALRQAVDRYPELKSAIGAFGSRETFRYFMLSKLIDRAYTKPRGFAGDYQTMELIYENSPRGDGKLGAFIDEWGLNLVMAKAVRNRRELLTQAIAEEYDRWNHNGLMPVTSLASGSAREVFDVFSVRDKPGIKITCTDIDPEVYGYASRIASRVGAIENTVFLQDNLLKMIIGRGKTMVPPQQLIYAVGLIDYLKDRELVATLNWTYEHLRPGGRTIIGQFHSSCPDRPFLDHIADWILYYRTEEEIRKLFAASKFGNSPVSISFEDGGVQFFAACTKG